MRSLRILALALVSLLALGQTGARADFFLNSDLKKGLACWHDDGSIVFLKPDGTEGQEDDPDVTPAIKIILSSSRPRMVSQEFDTRDPLKSLHVKVDVMASDDFQRTTSPDTSTAAANWKPNMIWYWSGLAVPDVDFWIRGGPGWFYKLANLVPRQWVTVDGLFDQIQPSVNHAILFCVPAGQGSVYLRNPLAE